MWQLAANGAHAAQAAAEDLSAGDFLQQPEERALALRREGPVDRQRLEAILEALAAHAVVEVAPTRAALDGGDEMVVRLLEFEVVVLVVDDRLAAIGGRGPPARELQADAVRARLVMTVRPVHAVAVRQQEVGGRHDRFRRRVDPDQAGADQDLAAAALL